MKRTMTSALFACIAALCAASPVTVEWKGTETVPSALARPFSGFLPDGSFLFAGGSAFEGGAKSYAKDVFLRGANGAWSKIGELPHPIAEGVCCETPLGLFCAGGTDGQTAFSEAFVMSCRGEIGLPGFTLSTKTLPSLPEPVTMGAAAADGSKVYRSEERRVGKGV